MSNPIAFTRGVPAPEMLAVAEIQAAASAALADDGTRILSYGPGGGYPPLRELLAERHGVSPAQIVITNGSLQGFALIVDSMLTAGNRRVFVERPTYDRPLVVLADRGVNHVGIDQDADGLVVDDLASILDGDGAPAFLYAIPNFQNPSGATMSEDRRVQLLELARSHDLVILEDDPYGELHFEAAPPRTLFERADDAQVIYACSFSKTVSPGLRVGYLVLPHALAKTIETRANNTYISPNMLGDAAVHRFITGGQLGPNIERTRALLRERCDVMCAALDEHLPQLAYVRPAGGYFLWGHFTDGTDTDALIGPAQEAGVTYVAGSAFGVSDVNSLRLAFSYVSTDEIREGVERLARAAHAIPA